MFITKKMYYCYNCGIRLPKKLSNYCIQCGANLMKKKGNQKPIRKCTICHKTVYNKENMVKCTFCDSKYHYSCVADWISNHNACPMCFNVYLSPKVEALVH